ncbi:hypothetical protein CKF54_00380 [Psittacicella hinzii]|uniref:Uncharacterized protein n=1 Tax=Psittacicella hinzii TaxID=2028575 RepID=A0A3A1YAW6_9GAMM|nr:hypothetical protein [Psittacicella hinzii]RIY34486.1 hypothetical protein CKF54_00380 [Psittacicella hinzii]
MVNKLIHSSSSTTCKFVQAINNINIKLMQMDENEHVLGYSIYWLSSSQDIPLDQEITNSDFKSVKETRVADTNHYSKVTQDYTATLQRLIKEIRDKQTVRYFRVKAKLSSGRLLTSSTGNKPYVRVEY